MNFDNFQLGTARTGSPRMALILDSLRKPFYYAVRYSYHSHFPAMTWFADFSLARSWVAQPNDQMIADSVLQQCSGDQLTIPMYSNCDTDDRRSCRSRVTLFSSSRWPLTAAYTAAGATTAADNARATTVTRSCNCKNFPSDPAGWLRLLA